MAEEEQNNVNDEGVDSEALSDGETSANEARAEKPKDDVEQSALGFAEELSDYELFAGDEDFYKLLAESAQEKPAKSVISKSHWSQRFKRYSYQRFSSLQKILAAGIIIVVSMLLYVLFKSPSGSMAGSATMPNDRSQQSLRQAPVSGPYVAQSEQVMPAQIQHKEPVLPPSQPLSLQFARNFFQQKKFDMAFAAYSNLRKALSANEEILKDFLQLKMALCAKEMSDFEQASRLFAMVAESRSPAVRIVANYNLCLLEIERKRYLRARIRAYNTIALIKAVDFDDDWLLSFECDCSFLVAECLTRHILLLSSTNTDLPDDLWGRPVTSSDPFDRLNEAELRKLLNSGSEQLSKGLLDPVIRRLDEQGRLTRWSVTSYGTPVEELLAKFAADAKVDILWTSMRASGSNSAEESIRQRPVSMYLPAASSQQFVLTAAGCVGLLACMEEESDELKVTIYDPAEYSSLQRHILFLSEQAISLWQKFVLTFYSDGRLGNAHFIMGMLHAKINLPIEAIAEYKLVANPFSHMSLAPFALLHSSRLKASLRDYPGARDDLKQLVEQYPDVEIYGQAYLRLAETTSETGLKAEAARLYQRVYNFSLSTESKIASAIGAARCLYETKSYEEAAKWVARCIDLAKSDKNNNLYSAYFLLGQSNLASGKYQQACEAFKYALAEQNSREQYVEAITLLVKGHIEQEQYIEALDTLESVRSVALSKEQSIEMLLLKCGIYRMLGLVDTAIIALRDRAKYISVPQLSAKMSFEFALCHIAKGNLESARSELSEILSAVEPGQLAQQTAMELADVCLKLGRGSQAVSVCLQLLESDVSDGQKQKILKTLAEAYNQQKNYDRAILALSGQWK